MLFRIMIDKQDFLFRFYIFIHFSEIYWVKIKSERDTLEARYNIFLEILKLMLN